MPAAPPCLHCKLPHHAATLDAVRLRTLSSARRRIDKGSCAPTASAIITTYCTSEKESTTTWPEFLMSSNTRMK